MANYDDGLVVPVDLTRVRNDQDLEVGRLLPPGKYHIQIQSVTRKGDPNPHLMIRYVVLAAADPNLVGAVADERLALSDAASKRRAILGRRFGLLGDDAF